MYLANPLQTWAVPPCDPVLTRTPIRNKKNSEPTRFDVQAFPFGVPPYPRRRNPLRAGKVAKIPRTHTYKPVFSPIFRDFSRTPPPRKRRIFTKNAILRTCKGVSLFFFTPKIGFRASKTACGVSRKFEFAFGTAPVPVDAQREHVRRQPLPLLPYLFP